MPDPHEGPVVEGRRIHIVMLAMMSGLFLAALDGNICLLYTSDAADE